MKDSYMFREALLDIPVSFNKGKHDVFGNKR
jgi:hypothetical protein